MVALNEVIFVGGDVTSRRRAEALLPAPSRCGGVVSAELSGAVDQSDQAESLWGVAQLAAGLRVVLLAEHPDVVAQAQQTFEQRGGLFALSDSGERVDQPEGAREEGAFAAGQAVVALLRVVAEQESVPAEFLLDRLHRGDDAGIGPR